jgi:hypothetical protein
MISFELRKLIGVMGILSKSIGILVLVGSFDVSRGCYNVSRC